MRMRINILFAANIRNSSHVVMVISDNWSDETSSDILCLMNNDPTRLLLLNLLNRSSSLLIFPNKML